MISRIEIPPHPFLAALYPALALAAENVEGSVHATDVFQLLGLSLALAGIVWILGRFFTRVPARRGILALLGVLFLLWYGGFAEILGRILGLVQTDRVYLLLPVWSALLLAAGFWALRTQRSLTVLSRYLNRFMAVLLLFPLSILALHAARPDEWTTGLPVEAEAARPTHTRPDIYVLVLDEYTSARSLKDNYGLEIGDFVDSLESRGFFVPSDSRANYVHTHLSMASMLNWTHLHEVAREIGLDSRNRSRTYGMIENNRAWRFLNARGYEFVFFPSAYTATPSNRYADRQLPEPFRASTNLHLGWLLQTPFPAIIVWTCKMLPCDLHENREFPYAPEPTEMIEWKFRRLETLAAEPGPKFVLAHLLIPHEPFVFNADCSHREPVWPASGLERSRKIIEEGYTAQIACLNRMLLRLVDGLIENSSIPPAILLQSDHGHGQMILDTATNRTLQLDQLSPSQLDDRTSVFAAYYLPGGSNAFYDTVTPVNVLPIVFNRIFDTEISLEEDAVYWSDSQRPFRFQRINPRASGPEPHPR
ncbi:MAG TPA: hypothetical protein VM737_10380 [Gemmatimonadota bacterium]|nr:hypothetical protein [Gemmatimonadota bacterium]